MNIAARLAVQFDANGLPASPGADYHGLNVVLTSLDSTGFHAEAAFTCPKGALVRLRVPCVGVALARVTKVNQGNLEGVFLNPVNATQLSKALGASRDHAFA